MATDRYTEDRASLATALRHSRSAVPFLLLLGCGDGGSGSPRPDGEAPGTGGFSGIDSGMALEPTYEPALPAIQREVFRPTCAAAFCHKDAQLGFDASSAERSYETLVGVVTDTTECGDTGLERVRAGEPGQSLLYLKLTEPPCGRKMPLLFDPDLEPRALEQIRIWIENGAPRDE